MGGTPETHPGTRWFIVADSRVLWHVVFAALSIAVALPLWLTPHLPLQDMPQHLAAVRVLRDTLDHGFDPYFQVNLLHTQYLVYYALVVVLSYPLGIALANKLILSLCLVALPWSVFLLLRVLGRDPRLALFAFGLTYNAHLILGFFNFIAALPLMFWGLAQAVQLRRRPTRSGQVLFAVLLVACFCTHVIPFVFLALGSFLVLEKQGVLATARRALPFVPAALALFLWLNSTSAGGATLTAITADSTKAAAFASLSQAFGELPMWLTDVLHGRRDDQLLIAWGSLLLVALAVGARGLSAFERTTDSAEADDLTFRLAMLSPIALVAYFVAPTSYDWIWPISARFPLLALLFSLLLLPRMRGALGSTVLGAVAVVAFLGFAEVGRAFATFERDEVGDLDAALSAIPSNERVAGLIFDRGSREVKFSPFLHAVALYQAQKGGAVMFTFADFPQSPFSFRAGVRPPRVTPRWEWLPDRVNPARDLHWYRYVLVRGGPGRIERQPADYSNVFRGARWSVWRRR